MESKVSIPKPCNENWNSMLPNKKGRFCSSCNTTVIDFTKMNDLQIQKYFSENSQRKDICGYFKCNQVENKNSIRYNNLRNRINRIKVKPIKIIALFLLSFLFTFSSCIMGKRAEEKPEELIENDTVNKNAINNTVEKKKDSIETKVSQIKKRK